MGYYRGDGANYYRGDYYRGDPFLGALVGSVVGKAAGRVGRFIGSKLGGSAGRAVASVARDAAPGIVGGVAGYTVGRALPTLPGPDMTPIGPDGKRVKGGKYVWTAPRRRMNPLNPRALKRALRRAEGFEKFAKRTVNAMYRVIDGRKVRTYKKSRRAS